MALAAVATRGLPTAATAASPIAMLQRSVDSMQASVAGKTCPLNVCCSQYGFCGTTSEFCGTGCQSDCTQPSPDVPASSVQSRVVGYWEAWNSNSPCVRIYYLLLLLILILTLRLCRVLCPQDRSLPLYSRI